MEPTLSKQAAKMLQIMDVATRGRLKKGILKIPDGDIKPMQGFSDGRLRLRIGKYRVVFIYTTGEDGSQGIHVIEIGPRGDIYK
jgi:mRNA interferase RelE/StbE